MTARPLIATLFGKPYFWEEVDGRLRLVPMDAEVAEALRQKITEELDGV